MEFSFQDLVLLRAAVSLRANHVTPQRLRRALRDLARQLPHDRPLSGVRLYADGGEVFVRDGRSAWEPGTGQSVFIFDVDDLARRTRVAPRSRRTTAAPAPGNRGRSRRL